MKNALLIDYKWCTGCHTCEIACQQAHNGYAPTEIGEEGKFGIRLSQIGPIQLAPKKYQLEYVPIPTSLCDLCAERTAKGKVPTCVKHCQANCMQFGSVEELAAKMDSSHMVLFTCADAKPESAEAYLSRPVASGIRRPVRKPTV